MPDALILHVPMEFGLEFVTVIGSDLTNTEREFGDHCVNKVHCVGLCMTIIDLERSNAGRVINSSILIALYRLTVFSFKFQELDIDLYLMARNLFLIAPCMHFSKPRTTR